jgi:hypothetical protein
MRARRGRTASAALFNVLTILIVLFMLGVIVLLVAAFAAPDLVPQVSGILGIGGDEEDAPPTPTSAAVAVVPTPTDTPQPVDGVGGFIEPTWTPLSPGETPQATATNTRRPTAEPSITPTFPPPTPTPTPTNTPTATPTPGPSPTATNTRSAYQFTRAPISPQHIQNFANAAGCNWLGIAGNVFDTEGNPVSAGSYRVHVWGSGIDERPPVGGAPAYGPSGWEQFLFDAPTIRDYNVQLETAAGTAVSEVYSVQSRASCNSNLILFDFVQNH